MLEILKFIIKIMTKIRKVIYIFGNVEPINSINT